MISGEKNRLDAFLLLALFSFNIYCVQVTWFAAIEHPEKCKKINRTLRVSICTIFEKLRVDAPLRRLRIMK